MTLTTNDSTNTTSTLPPSESGPTPSAPPAGSDAGRRVAAIAAALVAVAIVGLAGWYFLIRSDAPAGVNVAESAAARSEAIAQRSDDAGQDAGAAATAGDVSGRWTVDTSIGEFTDACLTEVCSSTFAGFRIDEVLVGVGDVTVVGRTPGVVGEVAIENDRVVGAEFRVDMTGLVTDSGARNAAMRSQAIETAEFPTAGFRLTSPIDVGGVGEGETVTVSATGELTIHGVTRPVQVPLTAELDSGVIVIVGEVALALADFDIATPSAPIVASVEDTAILELQLFLTR